eukprot:6178570-Pleurochrysis_carterae.AAC.2
MRACAVGLVAFGAPIDGRFGALVVTRGCGSTVKWTCEWVGAATYRLLSFCEQTCVGSYRPILAAFAALQPLELGQNLDDNFLLLFHCTAYAALLDRRDQFEQLRVGFDELPRVVCRCGFASTASKTSTAAILRRTQTSRSEAAHTSSRSHAQLARVKQTDRLRLPGRARRCEAVAASQTLPRNKYAPAMSFTTSTEFHQAILQDYDAPQKTARAAATFTKCHRHDQHCC